MIFFVLHTKSLNLNFLNTRFCESSFETSKYIFIPENTTKYSPHPLNLYFELKKSVLQVRLVHFTL